MKGEEGMGRSFRFSLVIAGLAVVCLLGAKAAFAAEPIVVGVPTSLGYPEGMEAHKAVELAVSEINQKGGLKVGEGKRKLEVAPLDIRDAAPGVPVPEALVGIEKLILEKKPTAIVVGPFRSEALIPGMDLFSKYKVPMLGTIAMSPVSQKKVKEEPEKYKYVFRVGINAPYFVNYLAGTMKLVKTEFGFNKVYLMHQDVAWAKATADGVKNSYFDKEGWEVLGLEAYPTGTSDFSSALLKAREAGAQVIMPIFDMPQGGTLVKQWKSIDVPALMCGYISPLCGSEAWKIFDGKIGGAMNCMYELGSGIASDKIPASVEFYNKYKRTYGKEIQTGHGSAPAYEAVYILAEAIQRAGSLDPDAITAEIKKTDRMGVMGRIRFDEGNQAVFGLDPKEAAVGVMFQWTEDGRREIVFPESMVTGKMILPKGLKSAK
jgi:branched-chain amino acid transport system substrate-binding protein